MGVLVEPDFRKPRFANDTEIDAVRQSILGSVREVNRRKGVVWSKGAVAVGGVAVVLGLLGLFGASLFGAGFPVRLVAKAFLAAALTGFAFFTVGAARFLPSVRGADDGEKGWFVASFVVEAAKILVSVLVLFS